MGFSAAIAAAAVIGGSMAYGARQQRKMAQEEQRQTEAERQRVEAVQREITAETVASPMPVPDSQDQRRAKRRSIADQMRRRGRASTILTGDGPTSDPLG